MKNYFAKLYLFITLTIFSVVSLWAAPGGPLDPDGTDDPLPPDPTPIDNLSLILIFAAVSLAVYFLIKRKRRLA